VLKLALEQLLKLVVIRFNQRPHGGDARSRTQIDPEVRFTGIEVHQHQHPPQQRIQVSVLIVAHL